MKNQQCDISQMPLVSNKKVSDTKCSIQSIIRIKRKSERKNERKNERKSKGKSERNTERRTKKK